MRKSLYLIAICCAFAVRLAAQTSPAAEGAKISYWAGASVSTFNPDYGCTSNSPFSCWDHQVIGISPYLATSAFLFSRIGAEGEARFLRWHGPAGMTQNSYMGGPRVRLAHYRSFYFSGKFLIGKGHVEVPASGGSGSYLAYGIGGIVDYRLSRRLITRVDYEYQMMPGFKGAGTGKGGLTPNGFSIGVMYAIR